MGNQNSETLEKIIGDHVLPGSVIVTEAWRGYVNLSTLNNRVYDHQVVIHADNFVDALHDEVHTHTIEGLKLP